VLKGVLGCFCAFSKSLSRCGINELRFVFPPRQRPRLTDLISPENADGDCERIAASAEWIWRAFLGAETSLPGSTSSLDHRHTTVTVTIPRLAAGDVPVAGLRGVEGGQVALGEFAAERRPCRRGCRLARDHGGGLSEPMLAATATVVFSDSVAGRGHNRRSAFRGTPVLETCIGLFSSFRDHVSADR